MSIADRFCSSGPNVFLLEPIESLRNSCLLYDFFSFFSSPEGGISLPLLFILSSIYLFIYLFVCLFVCLFVSGDLDLLWMIDCPFGHIWLPISFPEPAIVLVSRDLLS